MGVKDNMKRPCKYCNNEFEFNDTRQKTCGCWRIRKSIGNDKKFEIYRGNMCKQFQNPKYQYFRLYHDENLSQDIMGKVEYFYIRPCVEEVDFNFGV